MKVLWLASWYPNRLDHFTGDFIQRHARAVSRFCEVEVIYVKKDENLPANTSEIKRQVSGNLAEQVIYYNSPRTSIGIIDRFISFLLYKKYFRQAISRYISDHGKPSCIHVHVAMNAGVAALEAKKKWNIPFFVTEHWVGYYRECVPSIYDKDPLFRKMNKEVLENAALFFPVSKGLGETVKANFTNIPFRAIPNTVDTGIFYYKPASTPRFRFIHISYMNYQKNPEGIIAAAAKLRHLGYDFELFMLGNDTPALRAIANNYGLLDTYVFFSDAVPYHQVAIEMQRSSALVLFSRFENLPCVILEALCCGLPVISTNFGGIPEVVDRENGLMVESGNIQQLADAMQTMIDGYANFNRERIAANAAALFNYDTVGKMIMENYSGVSSVPQG
jgi:glycosyltransferase involved in cell wall biosynthesis